MRYIDFDGVILDTEDHLFYDWYKIPNYHELTEEDKIKIANMYESGYSSKEIAEEMHRNVATVRRYRQYKCCA